MALCCKKKARPYVDLIVAYGWGILSIPGSPRLDWELLVGFYLNVERVELRNSLRVFYGIAQCFSTVPDKALFEASVDDPELASHLWSRRKNVADLDAHYEAHRTSGFEGGGY